MSNQVTVKPRVPIYDYARVFVAYLVILGHCLPDDDMRLRPYIYAFHMPFFFLVSGMLHREMGYIPWKKLLRTLLIPYLFFNAIYYLLTPFFLRFNIINSLNNYNLDISKGTIHVYIDFFVQWCKNFIKGNTAPDGPTWFILALFWCKLFTSIINKHKIWLLVMLVFMVIGIYYQVYYFMIGNAMMVMPFFLAGFHFKLKPVELVPQKFSLILGIVLIICSIFLTLYNGRVSVWRIKFGHAPHHLAFIIFYLNAFLASYGVLFICKLFKENKLITICANALISILCIQLMFCYPFRTHGFRESILLCCVVSLGIFIICVLLHYLTLKYIPFVLGKGKRKE